MKMFKKVLILSFELIVNGFRELALTIIKIFFYIMLRFNINVNFQLGQILIEDNNLFKMETFIDEYFQNSYITEDLQDTKKKQNERIILIQKDFVSNLKTLSTTVKTEKLFQLVPNVEKMLSINTQILHFMEHLTSKGTNNEFISNLRAEFPESIACIKEYLETIPDSIISFESGQIAKIVNSSLEYIDELIDVLKTTLSDVPCTDSEKNSIEKTVEELKALQQVDVNIHN